MPVMFGLVFPYDHCVALRLVQRRVGAVVGAVFLRVTDDRIVEPPIVLPFLLVGDDLRDRVTVRCQRFLLLDDRWSLVMIMIDLAIVMIIYIHFWY